MAICLLDAILEFWEGFEDMKPWWRHQMETVSALPAICAENSPVPGEFPAQRPVTRSFDVFFDLRLNKRLSKQPWGWWLDSLSCPLWRHRNALGKFPRNQLCITLYIKCYVCIHSESRCVHNLILNGVCAPIAYCDNTMCSWVQPSNRIPLPTSSILCQHMASRDAHAYVAFTWIIYTYTFEFESVFGVLVAD